MDTKIFIADYDDANHASAITGLMDQYARDPMGGGRAKKQINKQC